MNWSEKYMRKRNQSRKTKHKELSCVSPDYVSATTSRSGIMGDIASCFGAKGRYILPSIVATCVMQGALLPMEEVYAARRTVLPTEDNQTVNENESMIVPGIGTDGSSTVSSVSGLVVQTSVSGHTYIPEVYVSSGGTAISTTVGNRGWVYVAAGGTVSDTIIEGGGVTLGYATMSGGSYCQVPGGVASNTTVKNSGSLGVGDGGSAASTTVSSGGYITVGSGGFASHTIVSGGGQFIVKDHGHIMDTTINGGSAVIDAGGSATSTMIRAC